MNEPEHDIRRLWHDQPRKEHAMSIDEIRTKADRFTRKVRRWNIVTAVLFVLAIVLESWQVWREPALLERVGDLLTIAALVYVMYRYRDYAIVEPLPAGLGDELAVQPTRMSANRTGAPARPSLTTGCVDLRDIR